MLALRQAIPRAVRHDHFVFIEILPQRWHIVADLEAATRRDLERSLVQHVVRLTSVPLPLVKVEADPRRRVELILLLFRDLYPLATEKVNRRFRVQFLAYPLAQSQKFV